MKYLIILHAGYVDETPDKKAIYEAENEKDAVALYHSEMAKYMKDDIVASCLIIVTNTVGGIVINDSYVK